MYWDLKNGKSELNGESFREFYVKIISVSKLNYLSPFSGKLGKRQRLHFKHSLTKPKRVLKLRHY